MNALDLRADHPELLGDYRPNVKHRMTHRITHGLADACHHLLHTSRVKPAGAR